MIALDTNVIVRLFVRDDELQAQKARALVDREKIFLSLSVLLECDWVLRSRYGFPAEQISGAIRTLCGLPNVAVEAGGAVYKALEASENGCDFADALHVFGAEANGAVSFATFDRKLSRRFAGLSATQIKFIIP